MTASSFQNDSESVSNNVLPIHSEHHWEGIVLNGDKHRSYNENKQSIRKHAFGCHINRDDKEGETYVEKK